MKRWTSDGASTGFCIAGLVKGEIVNALEGIRVVDMSRYLSGPTLTMLLADFGADVIKIEALPGGDPARESGPFVGEESVYYLASNRNKRSLTVDLRSDEGLVICKKLIGTADVFVENFRPGVAADMGLGWPEMHAVNPALVYCSVTGFGASGPGAELPGFDQTAQAMSGLMSVTGTAETGPLRVGIPIADSVTGVMGALGVVVAVLERSRTGRGSLVECSLMGSALSLMSYQAQRYLSLGQNPGREGNDHPLVFPQGIFKTGDGSVAIASGNQQMWKKLCRVLDLEGIESDERFRTNAQRMSNRRSLRRLIEGQLVKRPTAHWVGAIVACGVPCSPVLSVGEALQHPITQALGMVAKVNHSSLGEMAVLGRPIKLQSEEQEWLRLPPPLLGEHTLEICKDLGIGDREFAELVERGVVGLNTGAPSMSGCDRTHVDRME
jgi:crotonobetainyl-CoA:carnitine CoA-transferase CaiB-like acyl-CoA transferase